MGSGVFLPVEGIADAEEALQVAHDAAMDNALDWITRTLTNCRVWVQSRRFITPGGQPPPCRAAN